ncbi:hypothetical protein [Mesonia sp.]|uniref:hypothetical protein n=1 Tax=Mesonia sp. TaxID=1960830 RepID=UPI003F972BD6
MKNIYLFLAVLFTLGSCGSQDNKNKNHAQSDFCTQERELQEQFEDRSGELIYLEEKEKYAIRYHIPQTIDAVNNYVLCEKPDGIEVNDKLVFSGKSYLFLEAEDFNSRLGGHEMYFFKGTSIHKAD